MQQNLDHIERRMALRIEAESMVERFYPLGSLSQTAEKLLHELMVHKVELELQNEALQAAHATLVEMHDHYFELYEFAPVGFISITERGLISEANLTACSLRSLRSKLINQFFSKFIARKQGDDWHQILLKMTATPSEKSQFNLEMIDNDGTVFSAFLMCSSITSKEGMPILLIAFTQAKKLA